MNKWARRTRFFPFYQFINNWYWELAGAYYYHHYWRNQIEDYFLKNQMEIQPFTELAFNHLEKNIYEFGWLFMNQLMKDNYLYFVSIYQRFIL